MALINHRTHEIHFKIVYYGPGLCGKTTNLKSLHDRLPPERCGKMISIATDHERTLFFDFLPIDLGHVNGFLTRFHLYTVPGQVYYKLSRRAVLQGVDGLVFVADSHPAREAANRESLADLNEHLRTIGITGPAAARIPWVFQWNKRDIPVAVPVERLRKALNPQGWPEFEGVASDGRGVSETLRAACKAVLARLGTGQAAAPVPVMAGPPAGTPAAALGSAPSPLAGPNVAAPAVPASQPGTTQVAGSPNLGGPAQSHPAPLAGGSGPRTLVAPSAPARRLSPPTGQQSLFAPRPPAPRPAPLPPLLPGKPPDPTRRP